MNKPLRRLEMLGRAGWEMTLLVDPALVGG
jgi:hypothetical protein